MESYLKMIEFKTAVLLGAALKMGAIIGGSTEKQADALYEFGRNIGIAFQLKDDLLDVFGDAQTFGKQVGGDIIANKKTCLYLKALSLSEGEHKMELVNLYSSESVNDTEKVERVKSIYDSMDMQSHIHLLIDEYYTKAMKFLNSIDADLSELERFASLLKKREN
jgi:geranylgeranyl diphosphate synthase type II